MNRSIAGIFDPDRRGDPLRPPRELLAAGGRVIERGALRVCCAGPAPAASGPLCLLDGQLDDAAAIDRALNAQPGQRAEQTLAAGYARWGPDLLGRLRGDFVLLIWDAERERGLLARDQLGVRCLYVHERAGTMCFATEIHHLLEMLPRAPAPDPAGVAHWVAGSNRPGSGTLYEGIRRLAPGAALELERGIVRERPYWKPRFVTPLAPGEGELELGVRDAIACAVRRRLAPETNHTGVLMSGGLDSASVAAVAARQAPGAVAAYSAVFPEHPGVDESALIDRLRTTLGLSGALAEVRAGGLLANALEFMRSWQLPALSWGDFWALPLLRAAVSAGASVMLGGDGGDELFDTRAFLLADQLRAGHPRRLLALARELPGAGECPPRGAVVRVAAGLALSGALPYGCHETLRWPLASRRLPVWLTRGAARALLDSEDPLAWKRLAGPRWWAHAAHGLTRGIEEAGIFELHRRRAATAGLQARHPLLDLDLVELLLRAAPLRSFDRHLNRPALRRAMAGIVPDAVRLRRQKALFDALIVETLAGPDRAAVRRLLCDPSSELRAYVDPQGVRRALLDGEDEVSRNPCRWMHHVWRLTTAECWLRVQAGAEHDELCELVDASTARVRIRRQPSSAPAAGKRDGPPRDRRAQTAPFSTLREQVAR